MRASKFSPEVRDRAVRMVLEHRGEYEAEWAAIVSVVGRGAIEGMPARSFLSAFAESAPLAFTRSVTGVERGSPGKALASMATASS
jgi:hypothetical protein